MGGVTAARGPPLFPDGDGVFEGGVLLTVGTEADAEGGGVSFCIIIGVSILAVLVI